MLTELDIRMREDFEDLDGNVLELIGLHSDNVYEPSPKDYVVLKDYSTDTTRVISLTEFMEDYELVQCDEEPMDIDEDDCEISCTLEERPSSRVVCELSKTEKQIETDMAPTATDLDVSICEQGSKIAVPEKDQKIMRDLKGRICW